jgi:hypothetical protein
MRRPFVFSRAPAFAYALGGTNARSFCFKRVRTITSRSYLFTKRCSGVNQKKPGIFWIFCWYLFLKVELFAHSPGKFCRKQASFT